MSTTTWGYRKKIQAHALSDPLTDTFEQALGAAVGNSMQGGGHIQKYSMVKFDLSKGGYWTRIIYLISNSIFDKI